MTLRSPTVVRVRAVIGVPHGPGHAAHCIDTRPPARCPIRERLVRARIGEMRLVFELRFTSLFEEGRALSFPCDATGRVDLDALSDRARCNYFYARTVVGREFARPAVRRSQLH